MVATISILNNGTEMDPTYQLVSVSVQREMNRIPRAELTLIDGEPSEQSFAISDADFFAPGGTLEIRFGYEGEAIQTVFKGLVVSHTIEAGRQGSFISLVLKDAAVKLNGSRRTAVYNQIKDSDVISQLISDADLTSGEIVSTSTEQEQLVQYYCTDWDFMLARARANGHAIYVDKDQISTTDFSASSDPVMNFSWGISDIFDFEFVAEGGHQFAGVTAVGWDGKQVALGNSVTAKSVPVSQGNLTPGTIASKLGFDTDTLVSLVPMENTELSAWADGTMVRIRASALRGRLTVTGTHEVGLADVVELSGFSDRFNGKTLVTGMSHRLSEGDWMTDIQFGIPPDSGSSRADVMDQPAAGLLPGVLGLQIGIVAGYKDDPIGEYRVELNLPAVSQDGTVWARLCSPDAGSRRGYFFRPEVGDEVVVACLNNDPRYPVILGAVYSSKNAPPDDFATVSEKNVNKGFVSKAGTIISFVDEDSPSLVLQTPGKNKILLDDSGKAITLTDQNENSITMDENGVTIKSSKDFKIDAASGNVEISGTKVDIK